MSRLAGKRGLFQFQYNHNQAKSNPLNVAKDPLIVAKMDNGLLSRMQAGNGKRTFITDYSDAGWNKPHQNRSKKCFKKNIEGVRYLREVHMARHTGSTQIKI